MSDAGTGGQGGVRVAVLPSVVDISNAMDVRDRLAGLVADGVSVLVADLSATEALTLEGLHALVLARAAAKASGALLRLAALQPRVLRYLVLTGADRVFQDYATVEQASSEASAPGQVITESGLQSAATA